MEPELGHVGKFFDGLHDEYTETIVRCFPRYREMQWALLEYLPPELATQAAAREADSREAPAAVRSIVDLGCGTGNLSVLLSKQFPDAELHLVDLSAESLEVCRQRLNHSRATFHTADMRDWQFPPGEQDLIVSSIAIHHVDSAQKQRLFSRVHQALRSGGAFAFADQFAGATQAIYQRHIDLWKEATFAAGASDEEWQMWMQHQAEHDHHDTLGNQFQWLQQAGFQNVDCPWRFLLWAVIVATK